MKVKLKKSLSLLLALVMSLGCMSLPAFADGEGNDETPAASVAKVGGTEYATIEEAVAAWGPGKTLTLLDNVNISETIYKEFSAGQQNYTLQLGNYRITATGCNAIEFRAVSGSINGNNGLIVYANTTGGIAVGSGKYAFYMTDEGADYAEKEHRARLEVHGGTYDGGYFVKSDNGKDSWGFAQDNKYNTARVYLYDNGSEKLIVNSNMDMMRGHIEFHGGTYNGKITNYVTGGTQYYVFAAGSKFKYLPTGRNMAGKTSNCVSIDGEKKSNDDFSIPKNNVFIYYDGEYYNFLTDVASLSKAEAEVPFVQAEINKLTFSSSTKWSAGSVFSVYNTTHYEKPISYLEADTAIRIHNEIILNENVSSSQSKTVSSGTLTIDATAEGAKYNGNVTLTGKDAKFVYIYSNSNAALSDGQVSGTYTGTGYKFGSTTSTDGDNTTVIYGFTKVNTYNVTFDMNGGTGYIRQQTVEENATATEPTTVPTRNGYTFVGWGTSSSSSTLYDFSTPVTKAITLYAIWEKDPVVTFDSDGGSAVASMSVKKNATVTAPTAPTRDDYKFTGWTLNEKAYDFDTPVTGDITLVATWEQLPVVAKIGETEYRSLSKAITEAKADDEVELVDDLTLSATLEISKDVTINLKGHALSKALMPTSDKTPVIKALSGTVVIKNGSITYDISTYTGNVAQSNANVINVGMNMSNGIYSGGDCDLTLNGVNVSTIFPKGKSLSMIYVESGKLTVIDSNLSATNVSGNTDTQYLIYTTAHASAKVDPYVTISGTTTLDTKSCAGIHAIWLQGSEDTLVISGDGAIINADATWTPNSYTTSYAYAVNNQSGATCTIEGGKFTGKVWQTKGTIDVSGGYFSYAQGTSGQKNKITVAEGVAYLENTDPETKDAYPYVVAAPKTYVAQIGEGENAEKFETLEAAFAAAQDGETITLLADCAGNGIKALQGKFNTNGLTVDFAGFTYTVDGATVGSTGTETNGFQLLKDNKITFKSGTITSAKAKILIQNYSNLTLDKMTLTLNNPNYTSAYTLSNNNGNVVINDTTINANPAGGFAFDVCRYASYPSVNVEVKGESVINGDVEVFASGSDAKDGFSLTLTSGTMTGDIVMDASATAAMEKAPSKVSITKADTFTKDAPEGYKWVKADNAEVYTLTKVTYVAQIGETKYETLEAAFAAAQDGQTITLLADCAGNGIKALQGKFTIGLTVDFNGHTYTVDGATVGSTGTETNGFQLLKDNKITFQNGTITSAKAKILIQNYSNLTLDKMTLTLDNPNYASAYTLSNNNGTVVIKDSNIIARATKGFAFDVCRYSSYPSVNVTVKGNSTINGDVEISASNNDAKDGFSLTLEGGAMTGDIVMDASAAAAMEATPSKVSITKADTFDQAAPAGYKWVKADNAEVYTLTKVTYAAQIGDTKYETLKAAIAAANVNGGTVTLLGDYDMEANEPGYGYTTLSHSARENMIDVKDNVTIDLGGHTLSNLFNNTFHIVGANVTVQNGEMTVGTYTNGAPCSYVLYVQGAENFTVNNLTTFGGINVAGSTATINSLSFSGTTFYAVCSQDDADVTLNGGSYTKAVEGAANYLFWVEAGSTMDIMGGSFTKGTAKFTNGNTHPTIYGGTFDFDPSADVAEGYTAIKVADNKWVVAVKQNSSTDQDTTEIVTAKPVTSTEVEGVKTAEKVLNYETYDSDGTLTEVKPTTITAVKAENGNGSYTATIKKAAEDEPVIEATVTANVTTAPATTDVTKPETIEQMQEVLKSTDYAPETTTTFASANDFDLEELVAEATGKMVLNEQASAESTTNPDIDVRISVVPTLETITDSTENNSYVLGFDFTPYATAYSGTSDDAVQLTEATKIENSQIKTGSTITFTVNVPEELIGRVSGVSITHNGDPMDTGTYGFINGGRTIEITTDSFSPYEIKLTKLNVSESSVMRLVSLSVGGDIGINFYLKLSDYALNNGTVVFTKGGEELDRIPASSGTPYNYNNTTLYTFTARVAAKDVDEDVTLTLLDGDTNLTLKNNAGTKDYTTAGYSYSVAKYAEAVIAREMSESGLAQAMLDYGRYAKYYFDVCDVDTYGNHVEPGNKASAITTLEEKFGTVLDTEFNEYAPSESDRAAFSSAGLNLVGATLVLDSQTNMNIFFGVNGGTNYQFNILNKRALVHGDGPQGTSYVVINSIPAHHLNMKYDVAIYNGTTTQTAQISAFAYAYAIASNVNYAGQPIEMLVKALYLYNQAAVNYVGP